MGKRLILIGGAGPPGPAGSAGSSGSAGAAPAVLATWISGVGVVLQPWGNLWQYYFIATITPAAGTVGISDLADITVTVTGPGAATTAQDQIDIPGPYTIGTPVTWKSGVINTLDPSQAPLVYTLSFQGSNSAAATSAAYTTTATVTPPTIASPGVAEHSYPNDRIANTQRGVTTTLSVSGTMVNNPAGSGVSMVTVWVFYDLADSLGQRYFYEQAWPVTGNGAFTILIPGVWLGVSSQTLTAKIFPGFIASGAPIPSSGTVSTSFTFLPPANATVGGSWISAANFTGLSSQLKYFSVGGGSYGFKFGVLSFHALFVEQPTLKSTRCMVQNGSWNGSTWTAKPTDPNDKPFCDAQITSVDSNTSITVSGDSVTVEPVWPWAVAPSNDPYPHVRIHVDALSTLGAQAIQASFSGQVSPCSEIVFSSDGRYAYIVPDFAKALATATPWDSATIGDRLGITGGKLQVTTPLAPAVGIFSALINATSLGTLAGLQGGLPAWNIAIDLVLAIANPNFSHTKAINVSFPGFSDYTITSWTLGGAGGAHISFLYPTELQTVTGIGPQALTIVAFNEDGQPSTPASVTLTIPAATSGFAVTSPAAPSYAGLVLGSTLGVGGCTVTCTSYFERFGHDYKAGFNISWITPNNPASGVYGVVVNEIDPSGARSAIQTINNLNAGGSVQSVIAVAVPLKTGNWTIELVPVNADNLPSAVRQISIQVAPNVIPSGGVVGVEGVQFIAPGDGSKTHVSITTTITSTNGPGLSTANPQTTTFWFSADSGVTWYGLDWVDITSSGQVVTFELWRPTDALKTCKVAAAIGAWAFPVGTFQSPGPSGPIADAALPTSAVRMTGTFTIALVGAPIANGVTGAQINARTAASAYLWNSVTLIKNGTDGVTYWGLPDGVQWVNPSATTDPNFFYSIVEGWAVNASGTQAPTADLGGVVRGWQGDASATPGATVVVKQINGFPFNVSGSGYTYWRMQVVNVSRSGQRTIQSNPWAAHFNVGSFDLRYMDVLFGDPPPSSVTANLTATAGSGINISGTTISVKVAGAGTNGLSNPGFESGTFGAWVISNSSFVTIVSSPRTGSFAARISAGGNFAYQTLPASVGQTWAGTIYGRGNSANGRLALYLRFYSGAGGTGSILLQTSSPPVLAPGVSTYTQLSTSLSAPSGTASVMILIYQDDFALTVGSWDIDDATLALSGSSSTGGLGFDGTGNLKANTSSSIGTDSSGNLVAVVGNGLGVDPTTGIVIPAGTLSNLTGNLYTSASRPVAVTFGTPFLPSSTYPQGAVIFNTSDGKIYRNTTGSAWSATASPTDLIAGTLAAGVVYAGSIAATSITAGTMTAVNLNGGTLFLSSNGISTTVNNQTDFNLGLAYGMKCSDNASQWYSLVEPLGFHCVSPFGTSVMNLMLQPRGGGGYYGHFVMNDTSGFGGTIIADANQPIIRVQGTSGSFPTIRVQDSIGNTMDITPTHILQNGVIRI